MDIKKIFHIKELREKILFTLMIIAVFRIGSHIPIPGVDTEKLAQLFSQGGVLGFADLFSGGALRRFSIFALGIIPFINASIIMQLMTVVWPQLKEMIDEGEMGRKKFAQYTRYLAIALAVLQAFFMSIGLTSILSPGTGKIMFVMVSVVSLVAGTSLVMWLGELISERGFGNGGSIIIFVGIVSMIPSYIANTVSIMKTGVVNEINLVILILIFALVVFAIVIIQEGQRRVPVQYTKRVVGKRVYNGQTTYIPLKINMGGVLPIIFASSVLAFPATLSKLVPAFASFSQWFTPGGTVYMVTFFVLIFFFTYFYTAISFNPVEIADNIKKYGGFIVGIRPGKATAEYLDKIISRLTFAGAIFLAFIAITPMVTANLTQITSFRGLGGTALLIIVGVALDLMKQIETFIVTTQYDGILDS